ncbi:uncharacterized protein TRIVIDRAFT_68653 [Trichoderma virens Gv29-8]|uniref:Uncharacterized protein n=1 Tax=Hypocrea virens (strain Gv29-8 / FGSC 10586) TaxID=413071 RepID=G9MZM4_HYPVG|nr:uncharacterized protein TRIVIDRAFT_68653 [Trichoderma virens Gv29-8]EHK20080.1 hypothetical protein TRIVIDRAFT_68653 [Trichoderma virens Gv29-8]UKZ45977.1 hypothetical protein TrVGV298_000173 [Trichoderma virens]UKZ72573.1 hypothetical protein TrVFT333_000205 [Trichoderma virens FT-333]
MSARSITVFRTALRPAFASRSVIAPFSTTAPARVTAYGGKDDLGGPAGQKRPGGTDALKRNWMAIGGAAIAVLIGYNWVIKNPEEARQQRDKTMGEMSGRTKTEMGSFRHD